LEESNSQSFSFSLLFLPLSQSYNFLNSKILNLKKLK